MGLLGGMCEDAGQDNLQGPFGWVTACFAHLSWGGRTCLTERPWLPGAQDSEMLWAERDGKMGKADALASDRPGLDSGPTTC